MASNNMLNLPSNFNGGGLVGVGGGVGIPQPPGGVSSSSGEGLNNTNTATTAASNATTALRFQPAHDNPEDLKKFLLKVADQYNASKSTTITPGPTSTDTVGSAVGQFVY